MFFEEETMPYPWLTVACVPDGTPTDDLAAVAAHRLAAASLATLGTAEYFLTNTVFRRASLLRPQHDTAAGGPILLLNLQAMRAAAHRTYWHRWQLWSQVVAGTRPAQPYWTFLARHREDPEAYQLAWAQQNYLAQPRVAAMRTYNALPERAMDIPTSHLEAFQISGDSYANYGALHAVPGNSFVAIDGTHLAPTSDEYAIELTYLEIVNRQIAALQQSDNLVALYSRLARPIAVNPVNPGGPSSASQTPELRILTAIPGPDSVKRGEPQDAF
ncbi:hypothetical protein HH310_42340 [Actinoplanes sp. TBRC 11911]|uniref:hypothetical protein n=1 Tax=Actinoplanes sp. TBRC 11911 TaxID=2729386 RepID=UPI00145ED17D|nr:hypothetical protein [Actinoplanes sp. TBRC 11911]NMO57790.1 hypothetical protein [Actinoplanes sp. TBRC 11911]